MKFKIARRSTECQKIIPWHGAVLISGDEPLAVYEIEINSLDELLAIDPDNGIVIRDNQITIYDDWMES